MSSGAWLRLAALVDAASVATGRAVAWLTAAMVAVTFLVVVLRYFFGMGWIWMQELTTWMHALVFLLGASYTLTRDEHVRVDIFYRKMSAPRRALVDLLGAALLLAPTCIYILWVAGPYVTESWLRSEASRETGGLPFPFVPLGKSAMLVMATLLLLQAAAIATRAGLLLAGRADPASAGYGEREEPPPHEL